MAALRLRLLDRERRIKAKLAKIKADMAAGIPSPPASRRISPYAQRATERLHDQNTGFSGVKLEIP